MTSEERMILDRTIVAVRTVANLDLSVLREEYRRHNSPKGLMALGKADLIAAVVLNRMLH